MLYVLRRIRLHNGSGFSCVRSLSSAHKFSLIQPSRFSSLAANSTKAKSENANRDSFAATYLKNRCGFSPEKALMHSKYLKFGSSERPDAVVAFFKNHHFTDAQILCLVRKWPKVFQHVPESNFRPKIEFFHSLGFSSSDIVKVLTRAPNLLESSLEAKIIPCVDFLRSFLCSDEDVMLSIMRFPPIIRQNLQGTLLPNAEILRGVGVPESHIAALLRADPRGIIVSHVRFRAIVEEVRKLGLSPQKKVFVRGVIVMRESRSSTWKEKINHFKQWGWSEHQVLDAFRKYPQFMRVSRDKITRVMDFFANEMGCGFSVLMAQPQILALSFEKTIAPRCALYEVLLSKGLIKQDFSLRNILLCPQRLFLGRYVQRYAEEAPELLQLYQGTLSPLKE